ncbi:hypothetical protein B0H14DRAFT_2587659 [Mycena olivaceomarginata]|nr:hypothetical protein B0H14DRAFT_2587659 [Mycena olivaceomarginata]
MQCPRHLTTGVLLLLHRAPQRIAKYGRSNCAPRRKKEWARQCRPQKQDWECYWVVPYAAKFGEFLPFGLCGPLTAVSEALIHAHFKRAGAWIRPVPCAYCGVKHCEKFDYRICGGRREVFRVVEILSRAARLAGDKLYVDDDGRAVAPGSAAQGWRAGLNTAKDTITQLSMRVVR